MFVSSVGSLQGYEKAVYLVSTDENQQPKLHFFENPKLSFHVTKPEYLDLNITAAPLVLKETVEEYEIFYRDLYNAIIDISSTLPQDKVSTSNLVDFVNAAKSSGNRGDLNRLHLLNFLHGTNVDIADHYYDRFLSNHSPNSFAQTELRKAFWDIENDVRLHRAVPDPKQASVPINAITFIYPDIDTGRKTLVGYFCEGVEYNPQFEKFFENKQNEQEAFVARFKEYIQLKDPTYDFDFNLILFREEKDLITAFIDLLHYHKPSFLGAFNQEYDVQTLIGRLDRLDIGREYLAHPDVPDLFKAVYFIKDERAKKKLERRDNWSIPGYTHFTDSQINYLRKRKTGKKPSEDLEGVLYDEEIPVEKLNYGLTSIADLPYVDFDLFMTYSCTDTVGLDMLEIKTSDIDNNYSISIDNRVRFERARSQTTSIECLYRHTLKYDDSYNYILSNNRNKIDPIKEKPHIRGALVADPLLMKHCGEKLQWMTKYSNRLFKYVSDFDFKAMYPNLIRSFKVDYTNYIGKVILNNRSSLDLTEVNDLPISSDKEKLLDFIKYKNDLETKKGSDEEPEISILMATIVAQDWLVYGSRYAGMQTKEELIDKILQMKSKGDL